MNLDPRGMERRKEDLPGVQLHKRHLEAQRAKDHVDSLFEQYQRYSQALQLSPIDDFLIHQHRQHLNVHEDEAFLQLAVTALKEATKASTRVRYLIDRRREIFDILQSDPSFSSKGGEGSVDEKMGSKDGKLFSSLAMLHRCNVELVEAVAAWRGLLTHPLPYFDDDQRNILLRLLDDALSLSTNRCVIGFGWRYDAEEICGLRKESDRPTSSPSMGEDSGALVVVPNSSTALVVKDTTAAAPQHSSLSKERLRQAKLLASVGTFPHTIAANRPSLPDAATGKDSNATRHSIISGSEPASNEPGGVPWGTRVTLANAMIQEEYDLVKTLLKEKILGVRNGICIPLLRAVFDAIGPQQMPDMFAAQELTTCVANLKVFAHQWSWKDKRDRKLPFRPSRQRLGPEADRPESREQHPPTKHRQSPSRSRGEGATTPSHLGQGRKAAAEKALERLPYWKYLPKAEDWNGDSIAMALLYKNVLRLMRDRWRRWEDFLMSKRRQHALASSLIWLSERSHARSRFETWAVLGKATLERKQRQALESAADVAPAPPSGALDASIASRGPRRGSDSLEVTSPSKVSVGVQTGVKGQRTIKLPRVATPLVGNRARTPTTAGTKE
jgi:hypothetical protein